MAIRKFKPTTPGQRNKAISAFDEITCTTPEKSLLEPIRKSGGRNNTGKMTMRYIGGGHKRMYRIIDFRRDKDNCPATVKTIEYDPNRSARIALVVYADGEKRYIIAPAGIRVGQTIMSGPGVAPELGNTLPLSEIPLGTIIHSTTSSSVPVRVPQWPAAPEHSLSLQHARASMPSSASLRVRPEWCS